VSKLRASHYQLLGVDETASPEELAAAYRRLVKEVHPDHAAHLGVQERRRRDRATAQLNVAYAAARRAALERSETPARQLAPPSSRDAVPGACDLCGAQPARTRDLRLRSTWVRAAVPGAPDPKLCDGCATSFGPAPDDVPHRTQPSDPGRPALRPGLPRLLAVSLFALLAGVLALTLGSSPERSELAVGSCVAWSGHFSAVACASPHSGTVVSSASSPGRCPPRTSFVVTRVTVYCIDTTRH
jgi:hypothetical protein